MKFVIINNCITLYNSINITISVNLSIDIGTDIGSRFEDHKH